LRIASAKTTGGLRLRIILCERGGVAFSYVSHDPEGYDDMVNISLATAQLGTSVTASLWMRYNLARFYPKMYIPLMGLMG
jgi:hypothetical protein